MRNETETNPTPLARTEDMVVQELPDEVLVYDLRNHKAHCLNRTAAFVWNRCDGRSTPDEIAKLMEKEWHSPVSVDAVWFTLNKLSKADLLQEKITLPHAKAGISRRSAIRRIGVGALMIPAVMTIVSPTAMAGASVPPACTNCVKKITSPNQCPTECVNVCGQCFNNTGCGGGGGLVCQSCGACANGTGQSSTVSWQAPGNCHPSGSSCVPN